MRASDYIVEFLIRKGITDVFGYPGGMVTSLMDSFGKYSDKISAHVTYHEQGAAFAACGYAQTSGKPGVAYATSGPGATNLITGICNAYFDSIPAIFITGQVNSNEAKGLYEVRQRGFQETDIVSIVKPITKYAVYIDKAEILQDELEKAYSIAMSGRRGPVLIDVPMNVFRAEINVEAEVYCDDFQIGGDVDNIVHILSDALYKSNCPVFLIGGGVKSSGYEEKIRNAMMQLKIPVVSSMVAVDVMRNYHQYYGFLGAYGTRAANFIVAKSDLVISLGTRLDIRQVGAKRDQFAPNAKIIRFDIDEGELTYKVHEDEVQVRADLGTVLNAIEKLEVKERSTWLNVCDERKHLLSNIDDNNISNLVRNMS